MRKGFFYVHPNNKTVCAEVVKVFPIPGKDESKVKITWWNMKYGSLALCWHITETFRKTNVFWKEWKILQPK